MLLQHFLLCSSYDRLKGLKIQDTHLSLIIQSASRKAEFNRNTKFSQFSHTLSTLPPAREPPLALPLCFL